MRKTKLTPKSAKEKLKQFYDFKESDFYETEDNIYLICKDNVMITAKDVYEDLKEEVWD